MNRTFLLSRYVVVTVLALSLALPLAGQIAKTEVHSSATVALPNVRINNFGRIDANYYRGGQPAGGDYRDLSALGIKTVINLTSDDGQANEREMVEQAGMTYVSMPMNTHVPPTFEQVKKFLSLVNDPASHPVFVHCVGGKHRTGVMTAVYRMTQNRWSPDQAFKEMKQYKFGMDMLHPEFKKFVFGYHPNSELTTAVPATIGTK